MIGGTLNLTESESRPQTARAMDPPQTGRSVNPTQTTTTKGSP